MSKKNTLRIEGVLLPMLLEEEFEIICENKILEFLPKIRGRDLYIWGVCKGGEIVERVIGKRGISIKGFIDKKAEKLSNFHGYDVKKIKEITPEKNFVVVATMSVKYDIIEALEQMDFSYEDYFYLCENTGYNKEDIIYKGCKVGRYTYGYKELLQQYPLASSIGRYCSINCTARIWNNHPLDYVTTHPMLDHMLFYSQKSHEKRKQLIKKYGKYYENIGAGNSQLRNNKPVIIGNDVWIGANVIILPGVIIGDGAVLGAGAVITKNIEPYAIVGGVPAKIIRYRFNEDEIRGFLKIQWWNWSIEKVESNIELFYQPKKFLQLYDKKE